MIDGLRANDATKPFFLYYAHTSVHGPIQAKEVDIERHAGRYEAGWNALREARFERQRALGIVPEHARLPEGELADESQIPHWDSLPEQERRLFSRHMEVYAAAVDEIDQSVGRLIDHLQSLDELGNTIIVLASDNGGTAEGGPGGTRSYFAQFTNSLQMPEDWTRDVARDISDIGGPKLFAQYPTGWARVSNTPFRSFKASTYEGGVHAPLVVSWPDAPISQRGLRHQFVFVSDLTPTILELTGIARPSSHGGKPSMEMDGSSIAAVLDCPDAAGRVIQYFECTGKRAMIDGEWKAVSPEPPNRETGAAGGLWELYNLENDPTETHDLAGKQPDRVAALSEQWRDEAWRNTVFPLDDDRSLTRNRPSTDADLAEPLTIPVFRPPLERFRAAQLTVLRSFRIEIDLLTTSDTAGVIVAHGDQGGGYLLAIDEGLPLLSYNAYGDMHRARGRALAPGGHRLVLRCDEVEGLRWSIRLEDADGTSLASLDPVPMLLGMAPFTGISAGYDYGGPVDWAVYERHRSYRFSGGRIERVRYVPGERSHHNRSVLHQIDREVLRVAD